MSATLLALIFGFPLAIWAAIADCPNASVDITFDVQPRTIAVGEQNHFRTSFAWEEGTEAICNGVIVDFEWIDNFQAEEIPVRQKSRITGESRGPINLDFGENYITTAGNHRFYVRASIDGRQITRSGVVQVTATGADVAKQAAPSFAEGPPQAGPVTLEVAIGNLTQAANIAEYIAGVFKYALSIGGIIATVMVVYGGVKWLAAAGDSGKITEAKQVITNAVLGLILLLGSYLILFTINPEIVRLRSINLPKIERAILTSNWCEEQDLNEVKITPGTGNCGQKGKVEARTAGQQVTSDKCDFQTCPSGQVCNGVSGTPECHSCSFIIDDNLSDWGISENDAGCAAFAPRPVGGAHYYCFFSEDDRLSGDDDVCAFAEVKCSQIRSCRDYDDIFLQFGGNRFIEIDSETTDGFLGFNRDHLKQICESNPCNIQGGCKEAESSTFSQSVSDLARILKGTPYGDLFDCLPASE